jgi:hypothetical protein
LDGDEILDLIPSHGCFLSCRGIIYIPDEGKGLSANDEYYQKRDREDVKERKQLKWRKKSS